MAAFGGWDHLQNVHRIEDGKLVQTSLLWPFNWPDDPEPSDPEVVERGKATLAELVERFGDVEPLPEPALTEFCDELRQREAAAERLSAPIEFVKVPDKVLAIPGMTQEQVDAKMVEVGERIAALSDRDRERYENYRNLELLGRQNPSQKRWLDAALTALNDMKVRPDRPA